MKKLFSRIIFGFSLGVTLLILSYIGLYYIEGQETFNTLILKLTDVTTFQNQILVVGSAGIMMSFAIYLIEKTIEEDKQSTSRMIVSIILLMLSLYVSMFLIKNLSVFDEAMAYMLIIVEVVIFALYTLFHCMQKTIDEFIINKKIKEKNS